MRTSLATRASRILTTQLGLALMLGAVGLLASCSGDDNGGGGGVTADGSMPRDSAAGHDSAAVDGTVDSAPADDGAAAPDVTEDATTADVVQDDAADGGDAAETGAADAGDAAADAANADADAGNTGPNPALPPDAGTVACPTVISGSLDTTDGTQVGRESRIAPVSTCGTTKAFPGSGADPSNPHLYDVYRFSNPTSAPVCFTFTLTDNTVAAVDAGVDAAGIVDAAASDAAGDATVGDAGIDDASADAQDAEAGTGAGSDAAPEAAAPAPPKYMTAYSTFFPTSIGTDYLGDVGNVLVAPQTMAITVPAGGTIDVVVFAVAVAPAGVGAYTLSCTTH